MPFVNSISEDFIKKYKNKLPPFGPVGYITYKRTYARRIEGENRTEEWYETIRRCCNGLLDIGGKFTKDEIELLYDKVFNLKCSFSGRALWQLGTETVKKLGGDSLMNCWVSSINDPIEPFCFTFNELMLGGGVGFNIQQEQVFEIPKVKFNIEVIRRDEKDVDYIVPDNREGWVDLLRRVLTGFFYTGKSFSYSTICIRGKGTPIHSFGGVASGPEDLCQGINKIVAILKERVGDKLRPIDCLDILNIIGSIVVAGNVRRSAQLALGDMNDPLYLDAKNWSKGAIPNWRAMSNNSIACNKFEHLPAKFWGGYNGDGEAYGLINLKNCRNYGRLIDGKDYRPDKKVVATNPCVTSDTWVMTTSGAFQVLDLIGKQEELVVNGRSAITSEQGFFKTGTMPILRVQTTEGHSVRLTGNHKIKCVVDLTRKAKRYEWTEAEQLKPGMLISLHNHRGLTWEGKGTFDEGYLLGYLVGDGTFAQNYARLDFYNDEPAQIEKFAAVCYLNIFGERPSINPAKAKSSFGSARLMRLAEEYGIYAVEKKVSSAIEKSSFDFYRGFLRGFFDADGTVSGSQEKGVSVCLGQSNLQRLYAVQRMLLRIGVNSTVYKERRPEGDRMLPNGVGGTSLYHCQADHELIISNDNLFAFASNVGFSHVEKSKKLADSLASYVRTPNRERFVATVSEVVEDGVEDVFDVQVPGENEFDANGIEAHNCGEVPLESYESCNLSEIFLPNIKDKEDFIETAILTYKITKTISCLPFIHAQTNTVVGENHRLGNSVTGFLQAKPELRDEKVFDDVYKAIEKEDKVYSKILGVKPSIKLTTVKPSGCRPWDALTTTDRGIFTLEELFKDHDENSKWAEFKGKARVIQDGTTNRITKTFANGLQKTVKVKMSYNIEVESTANHPWFVKSRYDRSKGNKYIDINSWIPAGDLSEGDILEIAPGIYSNNNHSKLLALNSLAIKMRGDATNILQPEYMNPDLAWLLGYLWGDGAQSPAKYRIRFTDGVAENLIKASRIIKEQFGIDSTPVPASEGRNCQVLEVASKMLWHWLIKNDIYFAESIDLIPIVVRSSTEEDIIAFIAGLVDSDGGVSARNKENVCNISTANAAFANHLQNVALTVGLVFGRSHNTKGESFQNQKSMFLLTSAPESISSRFELLKRHSVKISCKMIRPDLPWSHEREEHSNTRIFGKVEMVGEGRNIQTYDVEVENEHWFYAGAIKSHNTLSLLAGVTPGVHPAYASCYIRRIRMASGDALVQICKDHGYHVEPVKNFDGTQNWDTMVVSFPIKVPEGTICAKDLTAIQQLDYARWLQTHWADNSVSVTVYYRKEELPAIKEWLVAHFDKNVKTVSFLLHNEHGFVQAPYEEISEEQYKTLAKGVKQINRLDNDSGTSFQDSLECSSGACPVK